MPLSLNNIVRYGVPSAVSLAGGLINRNAAGNATAALTSGVDTAANTITAAGDRSQHTLADIYAQQRADQQPYADAGAHALTDLTAGLQPGGGLADPFKYTQSDFFNDPSYKASVAEGQRLIEHSAANRGGLSSGATLKAISGYGVDQANKAFNADYARQEGTFRADQADRYSRLRDVVGIGQTATASDVAAAGQYGTNSSNVTTNTADNLANLQTEKANAIAAGDVAKANAITGTMEQITNGLTKASDSASIVKALGPAAPTLASLGTGAVGGLAGVTGAGSLAATGGGAAAAGLIPTSAPMTVGALAGGGAAAGTAGTTAAGTTAAGGAGGGGGAAITGLLTNPITIAIGAGIIGVTALLKSQAHWEANTWVQGFQNKFDANIKQITGQFQSLAQSGQLDQATAAQIRDSVANAFTEYNAKREQFAKGGKDNKKVADQAKATFDQYYGTTLNEMDQVIAGLPA